MHLIPTQLQRGIKLNPYHRVACAHWTQFYLKMTMAIRSVLFENDDVDNHFGGICSIRSVPRHI